MDKRPVDESPEWSDSELIPLITLKLGSVVDMMDMTSCPLPKCSEVLTPRSPATIGFEDQDSSVAQPRTGGPFSRYAGGRKHIRRVAGLTGVQHAGRLGSACNYQISHSLRRRLTAVSTTRSSEHRSLSLSVIRCRDWIPR